jgi:hypothetical protein
MELVLYIYDPTKTVYLKIKYEKNDFQVKGESEAKFMISIYIYNYVIDHVN